MGVQISQGAPNFYIMEFKKGCSPLGGSAIPYVEFKVSGGDQKVIDKLALEINTLIMSSLLEESGEPGD